MAKRPAGRPKGSNGKKYSVRAALDRRFGSTEAFITHILTNIETLIGEETDKAVKYWLELLKYVEVTADKVLEVDEGERTIIINNNVSSEENKNKDPREK